MSKAEDYNRAELVAGRLTMAHVTALVRHFQVATAGLSVDGMAGPSTRAAIEQIMIPVATPVGRFMRIPLPTLGDGRKAVVTSEFRPADRPDHNGVDWFYPWRAGDDPSFVGDHGAAGKPGAPEWVVPVGVYALAAAAGVVQIAGNSATGFRCWIDHGNGLRSGYFHMLNLLVSISQHVSEGDKLGLVGDNPADNDGRHLHFEASPVDRYAPLDPQQFIR